MVERFKVRCRRARSLRASTNGGHLRLHRTVESSRPTDRQTMCEDRPLVLTPARIGAEHACGRGIPGGSMDG